MSSPLVVTQLRHGCYEQHFPKMNSRGPVYLSHQSRVQELQDLPLVCTVGLHKRESLDLDMPDIQYYDVDNNVDNDVVKREILTSPYCPNNVGEHHGS